MSTPKRQLHDIQSLSLACCESPTLPSYYRRSPMKFDATAVAHPADHL